MECIYCHKIFSGKPTLVKHQRSTKKCLEIQQTLGVEIKKLSYSCKICNKEITSNNGLSYHENKCKKKSVDLQQTVIQLKKEVDELKSNQNLILNNTTNNTTNNTLNNTLNNTTNNTNISIINYMTEERVLQIFKDHFQVKDLPQKELGKFTIKHILSGEDKPVYKCTDLSRKCCVYIDQSGNEIVDKK